MLESFGQFTLRKMVLALAGVAVVASASLGGWTLWSANGQAPMDAGPPVVLVETPVTADEPAKTPLVKKTEADPPPLTAEPAVTKDEPVKPEVVRKIEPVKGKKHADQNALLANMIQQLHSEAYQHFVNQPGFGMSRMVPIMTVMPREWKMPEWTSEELSREQPPLKGMKDLSLIHRHSVTRFADSNVSSPPELYKVKRADAKAKKELTWEIKSLDLVGIAMHETPVVYVSENLPQMKDLPKTPTRDLDLFESEGLEELTNGKDIYIRAKESTIRVLGPIHAAKACLKCHHDSKEGDMLGAFSYTLREGQYRMNGGIHVIEAVIKRGPTNPLALVPNNIPKK
jgi:Protein of unknown function (DUF3365)